MNMYPSLKVVRSLAIAGTLALTLAACSDQSSEADQTGTDQTATAQSPSATQTVAATPAFQGEASMDDNIYVVFDGSGSMYNCVDRQGNEYSPDRQCQAKIDGGRQAMLSVVSKLPAAHVNLGLYVFDDRGRRERVALAGNNRDQMLTAVKAIRAGDTTPLGPAIKVGAKALIAQYKKQLGYGTYRLIVVTDGMPDSEDDVDNALKFIGKSGVPIEIYTIGFGMNDPAHPLRKASVAFTPAYNGGEVKDALEKAVSESTAFDPAAFGK
jgi:Ca-activated chloride channel homolog